MQLAPGVRQLHPRAFAVELQQLKSGQLGDTRMRFRFADLQGSGRPPDQLIPADASAAGKLCSPRSAPVIGASSSVC